VTKPAAVRRVEVITGVERRRRWSTEEKLAIVAESLAEGAVVSEVARRHGLSPQQLFGWRAKVRVEVKTAETSEPMFARPAALVQEHLRLDPYLGAIFVFRAKRADRIKLLDLGRQRIGARLQAPGAGASSAGRG